MKQVLTSIFNYGSQRSQVTFSPQILGAHSQNLLVEISQEDPVRELSPLAWV